MPIVRSSSAPSFEVGVWTELRQVLRVCPSSFTVRSMPEETKPIESLELGVSRPEFQATVDTLRFINAWRRDEHETLWRKGKLSLRR